MIYYYILYTMYFFFSFIGVFLLAGIVYLQLDTFGGRFTKEIKKKNKKSPHFKKGRFRNLEFTPQFAKGINLFSLIKANFRKKNKNLQPNNPVPSKKIDWEHVPDNTFIFLGHSSLFIKIQGISILVDPVNTTYASPMKGVNRSFPLQEEWSIGNLKQLDYVFISHDHYDHLDRQTIKSLRKFQAEYICGLGVSMHLLRWKIAKNKIKEMDWWDTITLKNGIDLHYLPTRHFSGRKWYRNNTLWGSFLLETTLGNIYLGADSGYGKHFKMIQDKFPKIEWAFMELGQYNAMWPYIHMCPDDFKKAVNELKAEKIIPIHHSRFALSSHAWNAPMIEVLNMEKDFHTAALYIPKIGEVVSFNQKLPNIKKWWI